MPPSAPQVRADTQTLPPALPLPPQTIVTRHRLADLNAWCKAEELDADETATIAALRDATKTTGKDCEALVSAASQAKALNISGKGLKTLAPLASLTQLETLVAYGNPVEDLAPLAGMTRLNGLHTDDGTYTTLAPLKGLTALETIALAKAPVSDLTPLAALPRLRQLWAFQMPISDLAPLAHLQQLQNLYMWDDKITTLAPLAGLTSLTDLALSGNQISDISALSAMTNLKAVDLSYQRGSRPLLSVAPLAALPDGALADLDKAKLLQGNGVEKEESACPTTRGPVSLRAVCLAYRP